MQDNASSPSSIDRSHLDPKRRFSDRVRDYVRFRPGYPDALLPWLRSRIGLQPDWKVADIGSGTGRSAEPFLANGNIVFAVEPNAEMRAAAEERLAHFPEFRSVAGSAEETTLAASVVDLIVVGQAFHWFDRTAARAEFIRIGQPGAWTALLWNRRETESTPFLRAYEALLQKFGTDYQQVRHDRIAGHEFADFFSGDCTLHAMPNQQELDRAGLTGRLLSSSYTPGARDPRRVPMLEELDRIFAEHQEHGTVRIEYVTEVILGRLGERRG